MASGYINDAYPLPPAPNTLHRKRRCIVVLAYNNPSAVPAAIIDSVGNCLAQLLVHEIMCVAASNSRRFRSSKWGTSFLIPLSELQISCRSNLNPQLLEDNKRTPDFFRYMLFYEFKTSLASSSVFRFPCLI